MHLTDARRLQPGHDFGHHDVCVVGAGAAGAYVAHRLAQRGLAVLLVEAGGHTSVDGEALGIARSEAAGGYQGATLGRAFGLGGTSARWSGQLVPHLEVDVARADPRLSSAWQHIVDLVSRHAPEVRAALGIPDAGQNEAFGPLAQRLAPLGLRLVASDWLPFHQRNLAKLLYAAYPGRGRVDVCLHAVVRAWSVSDDGAGARLDSLTLRSAGHDYTVHAPAFVLAAGALESARILLEIQASLGASPFRSTQIGRNLTDHLSCRVAAVPAGSWAAITEALAPRFDRGRLRSARILDGTPSPGNSRGYFHFVFDLDAAASRVAGGALATLRARHWPELAGHPLDQSARGMLGLVWSRVTRSRLYVPAGTPVHLQLDVEQVPSPARGVFLGAGRDAFDRPMAEVRWDVSGADLERASGLIQRFASRWSAGAELPGLNFSSETLAPIEAHHPVGVCRLGTDEEAVVDPNLCVRGTTNLWLLSTGVFPTAGSANPAFSLLCLGEALAQRLALRSR